MRFYFSFTILLSLTLFVTACDYYAPTPMPRAYSSYDKEFKSVDGVKARAIGYDYSNEKNKAVLDKMRLSATSLVEMLDKKLNFATDFIYLKPSVNTAFYNSFDYLIRDELIKKGYILSSSPKDAVIIDFVAKKIASDCSYNVYLALVIGVVNEVPRDLVAGFYQVPLYDYKDASNIKIDVPPCPT